MRRDTTKPWPLLLILAASCQNADGDLHPLCETLADDCQRGDGLEVCCSDRGCSWIAWTGRSFTTAEDAMRYCEPATPMSPTTSEPSGGQSSPPSVVAPSDGVSGGAPGPGTITPGDPTLDPPDDSSGGSVDVPEDQNCGTTSDPSTSTGGACYGSPVSCGARYTSGS